MLKTALLPLPAAARGRASCGPWEVHTRWKATQNEMWSHKLSWCLEKCRQRDEAGRPL